MMNKPEQHSREASSTEKGGVDCGDGDHLQQHRVEGRWSQGGSIPLIQGEMTPRCRLSIDPEWREGGVKLEASDCGGARAGRRT